jgi:hypothetical protein
MALGICPTGLHTHAPDPMTCTFPNRRTKSGYCGRAHWRAFLDGSGGVIYRCAKHDTEAAREAAARLGLRVVNTDTKAERIAAVERVENAA